jgi:hypothetical protein
MKRIYLCHQLNAPTREEIENNRSRAAEWAAWIVRAFDVAVSADWIWLSGVPPENERTRALGLRCDLAHIAKCDELWMVGPRISSGMKIESDEAKRLGLAVHDFTGTWGLSEMPRELSERFATVARKAGSK